MHIAVVLGLTRLEPELRQRRRGEERGQYYTKVDCTGADNTRDLDKYRRSGSSTSYDDSIFGINYDEALTNWRN